MNAERKSLIHALTQTGEFEALKQELNEWIDELYDMRTTNELNFEVRKTAAQMVENKLFELGLIEKVSGLKKQTYE